MTEYWPPLKRAVAFIIIVGILITITINEDSKNAKGTDLPVAPIATPVMEKIPAPIMELNAIINNSLNPKCFCNDVSLFSDILPPKLFHI